MQKKLLKLIFRLIPMKGYLVCYLLLTNAFVCSLSAYADVQEFKASAKRIVAKIAAAKANRIEFEHSKILEVIGNSNQYSILPSNGKYVFVIPKVSINNQLEINIVYGDNKVQELTLVTNDIEGQSILIKQTEDETEEIKYTKQTKPLEHAKELAQIIKYMCLNKTGKYDITELFVKLPNLVGNNLKLTFDQKYSFDKAKLIGRRLNVKNTSKKAISLEEKLFGHIFENIVAVNLSKKCLKAKEEGFVYLISKKARENI